MRFQQNGRRQAIDELYALSKRSAGINPATTESAFVIWRPGVPSAPPAVATLPEVEAAIARADGVLTVYVDSSIAPANVDTIVDCMGAVTWASYQNQETLTAPGFTADVMTIVSGGQLHRPRAFVGFLTVLMDRRVGAPPSMTFATSPSAFDVVHIDDAGLVMTTTATAPGIVLTGTFPDVTLQLMFTDALFGPVFGGGGTQPIVDVGAGSDLRLFFTGPQTFVDPSAVAGSPAPSAVFFNHDAGTPFLTFPGVVGITEDDPIDRPTFLGRDLQPFSPQGTATTPITPPTATLGAAAGGGSVVVSQTGAAPAPGNVATDNAGVINLVAGAGATFGVGCTVTFSGTFPGTSSQPSAVVLTPLNGNAAALTWFVDKTSGTGFTVNVPAATPFVSGQDYLWAWVAM